MRTPSFLFTAILLCSILSGCTPQAGVISDANKAFAFRIVATPTDDAELVHASKTQDGQLVKQNDALSEFGSTHHEGGSNRSGSEIFFAFTVDHVGRNLAVVTDGEVQAIPKILAPVRKQFVLSNKAIDKVRVVALTNGNRTV